MKYIYNYSVIDDRHILIGDCAKHRSSSGALGTTFGAADDIQWIPIKFRVCCLFFVVVGIFHLFKKKSDFWKFLDRCQNISCSCATCPGLAMRTRRPSWINGEASKTLNATKMDSASIALPRANKWSNFSRWKRSTSISTSFVSWRCSWAGELSPTLFCLSSHQINRYWSFI